MHFRIPFLFFGHLSMTSLALYINVLMIIKNLNDLYTCVLPFFALLHISDLKMYLISA